MLLHSSSSACVFVHRALIEWLVFRLSGNCLSFLWGPHCFASGFGRAQHSKWHSASPWGLWRFWERALLRQSRGRKGIGSGLGWGNVSHFPCLQLAYPLRLISLTLYFSFSLIVSTGPSGHKSYLSQVARAAPGRWALSQVPLLGTDETWSEECGVWASRFCFISKARRNGLVGFVVVVALFFVFWILIRFFKCFAHLLFRDYELLPYYSRSF